MTFRAGFIVTTSLLTFVALVPNQALASTLLGPGKTVQAFYYNGVLASPEGEIAVGFGDSNARSLISPVSYQQGAADGSTILVGDLQIVITNVLSGLPFCTTNDAGTSCADAIDGFDFLFTGENITGVTVDPASAAAFLPVNGTFQSQTHNGLQLISPNEIRVDVTGDLPAQNAQLILDVTATPEPSTQSLFGMAALAFLAFRLTSRKYFSGSSRARLWSRPPTA